MALARASIAGLALWLAAATVQAQEAGDPQAGRIFAETVCAACHMVALDQTYQPPFSLAPPFFEVANTREMNAVSLGAFLITPHPTMPNLALTRQQSADVIAYIMTLRQR